MRGYFKCRVLSVEVGEKPLDDGSHFVNVSLFGEGSQLVVNGWTKTTEPAYDVLANIDPESAPIVGVTGKVSVKQGFNGGPARLGFAVEAVYLLDAEGNPTGEIPEAKARRNGRLVAS